MESFTIPSGFLVVVVVVVVVVVIGNSDVDVLLLSSSIWIFKNEIRSFVFILKWMEYM